MSRNASAFQQHTRVCHNFNIRRVQLACLLDICIIELASSIVLKSVWGLMAVDL